MESHRRHLLLRLLTERRALISRPAVRFLEAVAADEELQNRMHLCRISERSQLRNTIWISTQTSCWSVLLGNDPGGGARAAASRARLALEGLDMTVPEVLQRLRSVPVWFLALDEEEAEPPAGEALRLQDTLTRLSNCNAERLRRSALLDQVDAALEAGDLHGLEGLRRLMEGIAQ